MEESTLAPAKPQIVTTPLNRFFWEAGLEGKLLIQRCQACSLYLHPPVPVCPECHALDLAPEPVSGNAIVYTYTIIRRAFHPAFADDIPYVVAIVELQEQVSLRLVTRIVDCPPEAVSIGMSVRVKFQQHGDAWLPVFSPC